MFNCNYPSLKLLVLGGTTFCLCVLSGLDRRRTLQSLATTSSVSISKSSSFRSTISKSKFTLLEWQCQLVPLNQSSYLDAQALINDTARDGASIRNSSINYNDFETCQEIGKRLKPRPNYPILIHVFYPFGDGIDSRMKHLSILSFLATQCRHNSKLVVWYRQNDTIPSMLPMSQHFRKLIDVRPFGSKDIEKMGFSRSATRRLIYEWQHSHKAGTTDVARITILYNYGGIWIDSDVLILRNLSPLVGINFIYQAQKKFLNGAIMGAATKRSQFIRNMVEYMDTRLEENPNRTNYFKWAHSMFHNILAKGGEMPILPGCLVDGAWFPQANASLQHPTAVGWHAFLARRASENHVRYISPEIATFGGPFAYHWHGNGQWNATIVDGSLADRADCLYRKMLGIPLHNNNTIDILSGM